MRVAAREMAITQTRCGIRIVGGMRTAGNGARRARRAAAVLGPVKRTITAATIAADQASQASQARSIQSTDATEVAASQASQASQSTDPKVAASQASQLARNCCRSLGTMLTNLTMPEALFSNLCGPVAFGPEATNMS